MFFPTLQLIRFVQYDVKRGIIRLYYLTETGKTRQFIFGNLEMCTYSKRETKRVEKLYLYLTRKARKREEQSCSRQEELQRNGASDGEVQAVVGAKREHKQSKHKFDRKRV